MSLFLSEDTKQKKSSSDFSEKLLQEINQFDLANMTPVEALLKLDKLQKKIRSHT